MNKGVGYLIKVIHEKIKVKADADLKRHNLTLTQSRVLIYLTERGGEATQKEIETFMEVSHPTIVGILSRMEQNGFLTTWMDSENKRNKIVRLTEKALSTGKEITSFIAQNENEMLVSLTD
ncbi:MAG: MarR family winged helix-turn-helix transcriptional regulator, partial [Anaerotignum sp.]